MSRRSQRLMDQQYKKICTICMGELVMPLTLACEHTFCYCCIKTTYKANDSKSCPLCRIHIHEDVFNPREDRIDLKMKVKDDEGPSTSRKRGATREENGSTTKKSRPTTYYWVYESKTANEWWRFEPRDEQAIEDAYQKKLEKYSCILGGCYFIINFKEMIQHPEERRGMHREIKRVNTKEFDEMNVKGVGGVLKAD